jgi:hypothetical protein
MFRILDRYVYREMLPVFALTTGLFTFLHVMDRRRLRNIVANGAPLHLVPGSGAAAAVLHESHAPDGPAPGGCDRGRRLTSDLEVVGFGALGVSLLRVFRPFLVASIGWP